MCFLSLLICRLCDCQCDVLKKSFLALFEVLLGGNQELITSTLLRFGDPTGHTAMAQTVGYPAAIAAQLLLDGTIPLGLDLVSHGIKWGLDESHWVEVQELHVKSWGVCLQCFTDFEISGVITRKGVIDPTPRDVYTPILRELSKLKIDCVESSRSVML